MFKAGLIENDTYYTMKRNLLITSIISAVLLGNMTGFAWSTSYFWLTLPFLGLFLINALIQIYLYRSIATMSKRHILEIGNDEIRILSASGKAEESILPKDAKEIQIHTSYTIPESTLSDLFEVFKGQPQTHFMLLRINDDWRKLSFTLDSNYMAEQLKKIVHYWDSIGIDIKTPKEYKSLTPESLI